MNRQEDREIHDLFDLGLVLKALTSAVEFVGGIMVLFVPRAFVLRIADLVTSGELARDPDDIVANYLHATAHAFAVAPHYLLAAYLLIRGAVKLGLVVLILKNVRIAYPLFIIALGLFASYEVYRGITTASLLLDAVALFDGILIVLTAYEYRRRYLVRA